MVGSVAALVSFGVLAAAGIEHIRDLRTFRAAIEAQGLWPGRATLPLAAVAAALETMLGVVGVVSVVSMIEGFQAPLLAAAAALYAFYAGYGLYLLKDRPGVPCGCSRDAHPMDAVVVSRAVALAGLAAAALLSTPVAAGVSATEAITAWLASFVYTLVLLALPAALDDPLRVIRRNSSPADVV